MANRFVLPIVESQTSSGGVGAGYKLNYYTAGGPSVRQDTYTSDTLGSAHANPVVANSAGRFAAIFLADALYYVVYTDADDVQIWAEDNVRGVGSNADNLLDDTLRSALVSGGSAGAYTLTVNQTFSAYADGQEFTFETNHASPAGGSTLNVTPAGGSALGAKAIVRLDGSALSDGDWPNGAKVTVKYDGTNFQVPGRQQNAAKAWAEVGAADGTPVLSSSYNVTSVTDNATGRMQVDWATDFSGTSYAPLCLGAHDSPGNMRSAQYDADTKSAGACEFQFADSNGNLIDPNDFAVVAFGDHV